MAFGLFRPVAAYQDGDVNSYVKTGYLMTGIYTENVGAAVSGSPLSVYDRDITTNYTLGNNNAGTWYMKWEFDSIIKFKSIYFGAILSRRVAYGNGAKLMISNNGTDWTTEDSFASTTGDTIKPLLASNVKCRFIKVELHSANDMLARVSVGEGVI